MSKFMNMFRFYANEDKNYQLENDLTKALAVTLQENNLFLFKALEDLLTKDDFKKIINSDFSTSSIEISIQRDTKTISKPDKVYAISVSENELDINSFLKHSEGVINTEITDLVIEINNNETTNNFKVALIFEVKRNNVNTSRQLFDQVISIFRSKDDEFDFDQFIINEAEDLIQVKDWSWQKVMSTAHQIHNFQQLMQNKSKILEDFIELVVDHNQLWKPKTSLEQTPATFNRVIKERIKLAVPEAFRLNYSDRNGLVLNEVSWANELIIYDYLAKENPTIQFSVYPANTKAQGQVIFNKSENPIIKKELIIMGIPYQVEVNYHLKFSSFQSFFTSIDFIENDLLKDPIYTRDNFKKYAGRRLRNDNDWLEVQNFFDQYFKPEFDWRKKCNWQNKVIGSKRSRFDLSFSYACSINIDYKNLQQHDTDVDDLSKLTEYLLAVKEEFISLIN